MKTLNITYRYELRKNDTFMDFECIFSLYSTRLPATHPPFIHADITAGTAGYQSPLASLVLVHVYVHSCVCACVQGQDSVPQMIMIMVVMTLSPCSLIYSQKPQSHRALI